MLKKLLLTLTVLGSGAFIAAQETPAPEGAPPPPPRGEGRGEGRGQRVSPEERFKALDTDADGVISFEEFSANPRFKEMDEERVKDFFARIDADKDGKVTLEEYSSGAGFGGGAGGRGGRFSLETLDADKDGKVTFEEFKAGPRSQNADEEQLKERFARMDKDGNGVIEGEELTPAPREGRGGPGGEGRGEGRGGPRGEGRRGGPPTE